jgi:hypothetical protein
VKPEKLTPAAVRVHGQLQVPLHRRHTARSSLVLG